MCYTSPMWHFWQVQGRTSASKKMATRFAALVGTGIPTCRGPPVSRRVRPAVGGAVSSDVSIGLAESVVLSFEPPVSLLVFCVLVLSNTEKRGYRHLLSLNGLSAAHSLRSEPFHRCFRGGTKAKKGGLGGALSPWQSRPSPGHPHPQHPVDSQRKCRRICTFVMVAGDPTATIWC